MFENAELGHKIDKDAYKQQLPELRAELLKAQHQLAASHFSVLVIVSGVPAAGKGETVNAFLEWLDARGIQTHPLRKPTDEERLHPPMWRYWRDLPAHGRMGILFGGPDAAPLLRHVAGKVDRASFDQQIDREIDLERMLHHEGTLVVKLWLHLSRKAMKKRLKNLQADPATRWQVTKQDWKLYRRYDRLREAAEHLIQRTSTGEAPWHIIEGTDRRYRDLTAGRVLLDALKARLEQEARRPPRPAPRPIDLPPPPVNVINQLDLSATVDEATYDKELRREQGRLAELTRKLRQAGRGMVLVFEGPDAAGKGGAIRRLTAAMDARDYRVQSVSAPTDEEKAHPYLWRFWRTLPRAGRVGIYDRSWYGRVLVERVEGFATEEEWQRAYAEINDFESQQTEFGTVLLKFWLAISQQEQLRRFEAREVTPYKQYKITPEDWRNRARWCAYEAAACDMVERTSTQEAPWVLVPAENKEYARLTVVRTVVRRLEEALGE
jgi:polyphosphate:AMP phosphotransferase